MSFLGSVGSSMHASGLEEVLSIMYDSNTVQHVISGNSIVCTFFGSWIFNIYTQFLLMQILQHGCCCDDTQ